MVKNQHCLLLENRHLIEISGKDATHFLHNLITTDIENIKQGDILPAALLSPQGKVLFDFLIGKYQNSYFIDISSELSENFLKRLSLYKLRSQIEIIKHFEWLTYICWNEVKKPLENTLIFNDKRFKNKEKIIRIYSKTALSSLPVSLVEIETLEKAWKLLRIKYGIAESSYDFTIGDVFPHDINYDQINGLSFKKGCYIGQEVVSRMHHRGTAKRRMLIVETEHDLPPMMRAKEAIITTAGKPIGQLGTYIGNIGLALMRIDRVKEAMDKQTAIYIQNIALKVKIAENMDYDFLQNSAE